jgi:hypothetical protein
LARCRGKVLPQKLKRRVRRSGRALETKRIVKAGSNVESLRISRPKSLAGSL